MLRKEWSCSILDVKKGNEDFSFYCTVYFSNGIDVERIAAEVGTRLLQFLTIQAKFLPRNEHWFASKTKGTNEDSKTEFVNMIVHGDRADAVGEIQDCDNITRAMDFGASAHMMHFHDYLNFFENVQLFPIEIDDIDIVCRPP